MREHDPVNSPSHYTSGEGVECIDAIEAAFTFEEASGFRKINAFKYLWRAGKKGDELEDLKKAQWYLDREIQARENRAAPSAIRMRFIEGQWVWVQDCDCHLHENQVCDTCQHPSPSEIRQAWVDADAWPGEGPVGSRNEATTGSPHRNPDNADPRRDSLSRMARERLGRTSQG